MTRENASVAHWPVKACCDLLRKRICAGCIFARALFTPFCTQLSTAAIIFQTFGILCIAFATPFERKTSIMASQMRRLGRVAGLGGLLLAGIRAARPLPLQFWYRYRICMEGRRPRRPDARGVEGQRGRCPSNFGIVIEFAWRAAGLGGLMRAG